MDLFENIETLPTKVQKLIYRFYELDNTYGNCKKLFDKLKPLGYTFEYGLDAQPFNLTKI